MKELVFHQIGFDGEFRKIVFRHHQSGAVAIGFETEMGYGSWIYRRLSKDEAIELMAWLSEATK